MVDQKSIKAAVQAAAEEYGIADWEIRYSSSTSISASMMAHELVEFSSALDGTLSIRVIADGKEGTATSERVDEEIIPSLVKSALDNSRVKDADSSYVPSIQSAGLSYPTRRGKDGDACDAACIKETLERVQKELFASDSRVTDGTGSDAASAESTAFLENSKGLSLSSHFASSYIASSVVVKEGDDVKNAFLVKEGQIASQDMTSAVTKALDKLGAGTVPSGKYRIVLNQDCMNLFLSTFCGAFSGKAALLGLSPYKEKVGCKVASELVTLVDDPLFEDYPAQITFDGDALPTYTKNIIENGVLETLVYNKEWAKRAGCQSTGNAVAGSGGIGIGFYSLYLKAGIISFDDLILFAGDGIYVTAMKGFHAGADPISGDFSIESSGFLIRDGKLAGPVQGFTVAGNFYRMLEDISALANDLDFDVTLSSFRCGSPSVLIENLSVAGKDE